MESGLDLLESFTATQKGNQHWCSAMSCVYVRKIFSCFSVVLMENGDVYTFGYGQHGQLGHGDVNSR